MPSASPDLQLIEMADLLQQRAYSMPLGVACCRFECEWLDCAALGVSASRLHRMVSPVMEIPNTVSYAGGAFENFDGREEQSGMLSERLEDV